LLKIRQPAAAAAAAAAGASFQPPPPMQSPSNPFGFPFGPESAGSFAELMRGMGQAAMALAAMAGSSASGAQGNVATGAGQTPESGWCGRGQRWREYGDQWRQYWQQLQQQGAQPQQPPAGPSHPMPPPPPFPFGGPFGRMFGGHGGHPHGRPFGGPPPPHHGNGHQYGPRPFGRWASCWQQQQQQQPAATQAAPAPAQGGLPEVANEAIRVVQELLTPSDKFNVVCFCLVVDYSSSVLPNYFCSDNGGVDLFLCLMNIRR
jgi:hypothetical protein